MEVTVSYLYSKMIFLEHGYGYKEITRLKMMVARSEGAVETETRDLRDMEGDEL